MICSAGAPEKNFSVVVSQLNCFSILFETFQRGKCSVLDKGIYSATNAMFEADRQNNCERQRNGKKESDAGGNRYQNLGVASLAVNGLEQPNI